MSKLKITTYELRDVAIVQAAISYCNHRGDVDNKVTICDRSVYPVFVAPMASVTDETNYRTWIANGLTPVIPRSVQQRLSFEKRMELAQKTFVSISLKEAFEDFDKWALTYNWANKLYICIDIAHGTLSDLYKACKNIKAAWGDLVEIMTGNVANPDAYSWYADAGVNWCRASVGSGSRCLSSANLGIHYGVATLIDQLNEARKAYMHSHNGQAPTKIIADGGIANFDDINKAIALGADAVMIGKLFAECDEACGKIYDPYAYSMEITSDMCEKLRADNKTLYREYYGMSTRRAQCETGGKGDRTSEGISRPVQVKYPVAKWVDNMQSYLRSAMTYTNSRTIKEMQENARVVILGGSGDAAYRK